MNHIGDYTFNFKEEVERLFLELGPRGNNLIFMTAHAEGDDVKLRNLMGAPQALEFFKSQGKEKTEARYRGKPHESSAVYIPQDDEDIVPHVCINENDLFIRFFGEGNKELTTLFTLLHETGHWLIHDGRPPDKKHAYWECAADAYAVLRLLQRFGPEAVDFVSKISWYRSYCAIAGGTSHLTTTVLDKIIVDSADKDFSKLTHDQTMELARTYAKRWGPRPRMLERTLAVLHHEIFDPTRIYTDVLPAWKNPSDFAFYVGAKILQPMLQEGILAEGRKISYDDPQARKMIADVISMRADGMSLESIFNKSAKRKVTSVKKALKMPLSSPLSFS